MNELSLGRTISDAVREYEQKRDAAASTKAEFEAVVSKTEAQAAVAGTFVEPLFRQRPYLHESDIEKLLLKSAWKHVYDGMGIARISSAADRKRFEVAIQDPPEFTIENIRATFGDYILNPREHVLRGLAEVFVGLDPAYRSHSKVKIGVKGLPKRVILRSCGGYGSWGQERLRDVINALRALEGRPLISPQELNAFMDTADASNPPQKWNAEQQYGRYAVVEHAGRHYRFTEYKSSAGASPSQEESGWEERPNPEPALSLKRFQNGNAHLIFGPDALRTINLALAEYYGEVLPDAEDDETIKPAASTAVAKDLQFYPTPDEVAERVVGDIYFKDGDRVLEPSCGDGQLLHQIPDRAFVLGIEVHPGRAEQARSYGYKVLTANFLEVPPPAKETDLYDHVVMNPPFYGRHYLKHIRHAMRFVKPGGTLTAILPATAFYDHGELPAGGDWSDLPVGSFASSGTRVPTGVFKLRMPSP